MSASRSYLWHRQQAVRVTRPASIAGVVTAFNLERLDNLEVLDIKIELPEGAR